MRTGQLTAPDPAASAATTRAPVGIITELHHQITDLETQLDQDDAIDQWAFCAMSARPGCRTFYDRRRAANPFRVLTI